MYAAVVFTALVAAASAGGLGLGHGGLGYGGVGLGYGGVGLGYGGLGLGGIGYGHGVAVAAPVAAATIANSAITTRADHYAPVIGTAAIPYKVATPIAIPYKVATPVKVAAPIALGYGGYGHGW